MNDNYLRSLLDTVRNMGTSTCVEEACEYVFPSLDLLKVNGEKGSKSTLDATVLEDKLAEFGFKGEVVKVRVGPLVTRYEVRLSPGVRLSQVKNVSEDLGVALMSNSVRIQAPIPGTSLIGIEVANETPSTVWLRKVIEEAQKTGYDLPIGIGVDITGNPKIMDLAKMPHLLIAGQTGSGKSVGLNAIILSLLYTKTPEQMKLVLVDPKRVEMASYASIPHLLRPVVTSSEDTEKVLEELVTEMERRYNVFAEAKVRNITSYNDQSEEKLPYIVAVIDEMADLMMTSGKHVEACIVRLAQLARATGIHMVVATQKPVSTVVTGLIKSNLPTRLSYQVASKNDSRVILDCNGAEKLLGRGDLLMTSSGEPERFHGAWVSDEEIAAVCEAIS